MIKIKISKTIYSVLVFVILTSSFLSYVLFSNKDTSENYIAIVELKLTKSIDHLFLESNADSLLVEYAATYFNERMPNYNFQPMSTKIEATMYASESNIFYSNQLPKFEEDVIKSIPGLNKAVKKTFKNFYLDHMAHNSLNKQNTSSQNIFYWRLSTKDLFTENIFTKVKFRKLGLTKFEFISIILFLSLTSLSLITAFYITGKNKENSN